VVGAQFSMTGVKMTLPDNAGKRVRFHCYPKGRPKTASGKTVCQPASTVSLVDKLYQVTKNVTGHDHTLLPTPTDLFTDDMNRGAAPIRYCYAHQDASRYRSIGF
jgi:hypothetical protein